MVPRYDQLAKGSSGSCCRFWNVLTQKSLSGENFAISHDKKKVLDSKPIQHIHNIPNSRDSHESGKLKRAGLTHKACHIEIISETCCLTDFKVPATQCHTEATSLVPDLLIWVALNPIPNHVFCILYVVPDIAFGHKCHAYIHTHPFQGN